MPDVFGTVETLLPINIIAFPFISPEENIQLVISIASLLKKKKISLRTNFRWALYE